MSRLYRTPRTATPTALGIRNGIAALPRLDTAPRRIPNRVEQDMQLTEQLLVVEQLAARAHDHVAAMLDTARKNGTAPESVLQHLHPVMVSFTQAEFRIRAARTAAAADARHAWTVATLGIRE